MKRLSYTLVVVTMLILGIQTSRSGGGIAVDFMPESCPNTLNVDKKGVFHVAIIGPVFGTLTSASINGVPALSWSFLDQTRPAAPSSCDPCTPPGPDGVPDIILKFDAQAVAATLPSSGCVFVTLSTNLGPGGSYVRILSSKKP
jgi:hypothetical protein